MMRFSGFLFFLVKSSQIQSNFLGVGLAFSAHLRFNDVDRKNLPLLEPRQDFYLFWRV
jgi:hypothetical protein